MEFVAFIIALAIAFQAFKGYRLTKQRTLLYVQFSFALLSAGLLVDSLAGFLGILARSLKGIEILTQVGYTIYFLVQVLAYGILVYAYVSQTRTLSTASPALPLVSLSGITALQTSQSPVVKPLPLLEYHPISEIVLLFLIVYIAFQTAINYSATKERNALLVFLGFLLLALSHLFFILALLGPLFFVLGHVFQLLAFVSLLMMLLRVTRTK